MNWRHELSGPRWWGYSIDGIVARGFHTINWSVLFYLLIWDFFFFFFGRNCWSGFRQLGFCKYLKRPRPQLVNGPRQFFFFFFGFFFSYLMFWVFYSIPFYKFKYLRIKYKYSRTKLYSFSKKKDQTLLYLFANNKKF